MRSYVQPGNRIDWINVSGADVARGQVVRYGSSLGIAVTDIPAGQSGEMMRCGVFRDLPKISGAVWAAGDQLLWDSSAAAFDDSLAVTEFGDLRGAAIAVEPGVDGQTTCTVMLEGPGEERRDPLQGEQLGITAGSHDQTAALTAAIALASSMQRALVLPAGQIRYTGPLEIPSNVHIYGNGGTSFGTQLVANGTAGIYFNGSSVEKFHSSLNNVLLDHIGAAGAYALKIENCYSLRFRGVRIDTPAAQFSDAAVVVENTNNDILFDDLIMQFSVEQLIGVRLGNDCGTIRFIKPDIEKCQRALKWEGGKIEVHSPYVETSSVNSFDCNPNAADTSAYLKVYGGNVGCAAGAVNVALRQDCHDVDFFGTRFTGSTSNDIYAYSTTLNRINFWGPAVDYTKVNGVAGYLRYLGLHGRRLHGSKTHDWPSIASGASSSTTVTVTGAKLGYHTARAYMDVSTQGLLLSAQVTADDTVTVVAANLSGSAIDLASAGLYALCDSVPRQ